MAKQTDTQIQTYQNTDRQTQIDTKLIQTLHTSARNVAVSSSTIATLLLTTSCSRE